MPAPVTKFDVHLLGQLTNEVEIARNCIDITRAQRGFIMMRAVENPHAFCALSERFAIAEISNRFTLEQCVGRAFYKARSEEHTSDIQSLMRISYAVFCLKKKKTLIDDHYTNNMTND